MDSPRRLSALIAVLAVAVIAATIAVKRSATVDPPRRPTHFQNVSLEGWTKAHPAAGNSIEGFGYAARAGVKAMEADLTLTADGILVGAHFDDVGGTCGAISRSNISELEMCEPRNGYHIAKFTQLLRMPFDTIYVDLKDAGRLHETAAGRKRSERAVARAISDIRSAGRTGSAVVMISNPSPKIVAMIARGRVRAGIKGYPWTTARTALRLIALAQHDRFELVCLPTEAATAANLEDAARRGVWLLAFGGSEDLPLARVRAGQGLGGLITRDTAAAEETVVPAWSPAGRAGR